MIQDTIRRRPEPVHATMESSRFLQPVVQVALPVLPLLAFAGLMALAMRRCGRDRAEDGWREAFLRAAVAWAALAFAFTELLSLCTAIDALTLTFCWGGTDLVLAFLWMRAGGNFSRADNDHGSGLRRRVRALWAEPSRGQAALLLWVVLTLVVTGAVAIAAPPNNYDSMTYHMSRIAHWWADRSIAFYPTHIQRQLYSGPLAEYAILQFFVLSGGADRLANLVQWFAFAGCAVAVSLLVRRLGGDRFAQTAAAFVVAVTPICILEATSTQNDLVCALLTAATLAFLLRGNTLWTGLSFGLALLVKSSAGLFVFPFWLAFFLGDLVGRRGTLKTLGRFAAIGGIALAFLVPHTLRNLRIFHNPLGEETQVRWIQAQTWAMRPLAANLLRQFGTEFGTPVARVNRMEDRAVRFTAHALRLNLDDPRNTFYGTHYTAGEMEGDEDTSANPLPMALFLVATLFLLASRPLRTSAATRFALLVWAGFLLFAWRISWQPWIARLHIPFLILASVPMAFFLGALRRRARLLTGAIVAMAAFLALQPLLHNWNRPVLILTPRPLSVFSTPRAEQYFTLRPDLRLCYLETAQALAAASCRVAGIQTGENDWEYPLWALTRSSGSPTFFRPIDVQNQTRAAAAAFPGALCARIAVHDADRSVPLPGLTWVELHLAGPGGKDSIRRFDCRP